MLQPGSRSKRRKSTQDFLFQSRSHTIHARPHNRTKNREPGNPPVPSICWQSRGEGTAASPNGGGTILTCFTNAAPTLKSDAVLKRVCENVRGQPKARTRNQDSNATQTDNAGQPQRGRPSCIQIPTPEPDQSAPAETHLSLISTRHKRICRSCPCVCHQNNTRDNVSSRTSPIEHSSAHPKSLSSLTLVRARPPAANVKSCMMRNLGPSTTRRGDTTRTPKISRMKRTSNTSVRRKTTSRYKFFGNCCCVCRCTRVVAVRDLSLQATPWSTVHRGTWR